MASNSMPLSLEALEDLNDRFLEQLGEDMRAISIVDVTEEDLQFLVDGLMDAFDAWTQAVG